MKTERKQFQDEVYDFLSFIKDVCVYKRNEASNHEEKPAEA
jgi:hypothetical protein